MPDLLIELLASNRVPHQRNIESDERRQRKYVNLSNRFRHIQISLLLELQLAEVEKKLCFIFDRPRITHL